MTESNLTNVLSTSKRRRAAKRLLKILEIKDIPKSLATKKLCGSIKIRKANGQKVREGPIYKDSTDAKSFVKELVKSEEFPVQEQGNRLVRTDSDGGGAQA